MVMEQTTVSVGVVGHIAMQITVCHRAMISLYFEKSGHDCGGSDNDIHKASGPRRNVRAKSFRAPQECPV